MRFSSKTFKRGRSRLARRRARKTRRTRRTRKQRGGGNTYNRNIPSAAVRDELIVPEELIRESVSEA